jgi:hypothetical protein
VLAQFRNTGRNTAAFQVTRCRAEDSCALGDAMRDQVRLLHVADTHVEIDVLVDEIDSAVDGVEGDIERRVALRQQ